MRSGIVLSVAVWATVCGWAEAQSPAPLPPQAHGRLPYMAFAEISPDGQQVAYIQQFAGGRELVVHTPGTAKSLARRWALKLAYSYAPPPKPDSLSWVSDSALVVEWTVTLPQDKKTKIKAPEDYDGIFLYQGIGGFGVARQDLWGYVVRPQGTGRGHPLLALVDKKGLFLSEYDVAEEAKAARLDRAPKAVGGRPRGVRWYAGPDGSLRARTLLSGPPEPGLVVEVREADGWRVVWKASGEAPGFAPIGFGADPNLLLGLVEGPGRRGSVAALDLRTGAIGAAMATVDGHDIEGAVTDPYSGHVVGFLHAEDSYRIQWTDTGLAQMEARALALFPGRRALVDSWSRDRNTVLLLVEGPGDPGSYCVARLGEGATVKVGDLYPAVPPEAVAEMRPYRYRARDGLEIPGYLTLPPGREAKNLPLILMPHGGPASRDVLGFDWWAQALAARGYAVLQPNFRGSTGYGADFTEAGHRQWGRAMQDDLTDGLAALVAEGIVDPTRVCIVGASYGGYAALAGATLTPDLYRCAVSVAGVGDLPAMISHSRDAKGRESLATLYWSRVIGDPAVDLERLNQVSPRLQAAKAKAPILLLHGKDDTVVPLSQSLGMRDALQAAGKPVTFVELEGEDHHLRQETTRTQMLASLYDFLAQHNPAD